MVKSCSPICLTSNLSTFRWVLNETATLKWMLFLNVDLVRTNFPFFVCLIFHEKYLITIQFPLTNSELLYFHYKIRTASYLSARNQDISFSFNVSTSCKFVPSESFRNATPKAVTSCWSILLWRDRPAQKDWK